MIRNGNQPTLRELLFSGAAVLQQQLDLTDTVMLLNVGTPSPISGISVRDAPNPDRVSPEKSASEVQQIFIFLH